jgi:hypothetical protein
MHELMSQRQSKFVKAVSSLEFNPHEHGSSEFHPV